MGYRLGVDMGTTFTAAAVANGITPTLVGLGNRALQIPSVLFLADDGTFLVGEAAEHRALADPERVVREFKRRIGDTVPVLVGGAPFSPQTLTARLLRHVVSAATERMGEAPERLVLTHPANWGPYKLDLLDQVAVLAGLGQVDRISEPLAAATQYATQARVEVGSTIGVYDLGGGTFDACVLRKEGEGFSVLGMPEGIEHLGGIDFDEALFQHVLGRLGSRLDGLDPDDQGVVQALSRLRRDCVEAKEALSTDVRTRLPVMLPALSTTLTIERAELEALIRPALDETMTAMRRAMESAAVEPRHLTSIVLIGGSSRIPLVSALIKREFGVPVALDTHPKHDVALGAVNASAAIPRAPLASSAPQTSKAPVAAPGKPTRTSVRESTEGPTTSPAAPPSSSEPETTEAAAAFPAAPPTAPRMSPPPTVPPDWAPVEVSPGGRRIPRAAIVAVAVAVAVVLVAVVATVAAVRARTGAAGGEAPASLGGATTPAASPSISGTTKPSASTQPSPSPLPASKALDPDELLVTTQLDGKNWELFRADVDSSAPGPRLSRSDGVDSAPVLSPDRKTVIYIRIDLDGKRTLRVAGARDLSGDRLLFHLPAGCSHPLRPAWSPTDQSLLAIGCRMGAGPTTLRLMRTDGTVVDTVDPPADRPVIDDLAFSPDGRRIGFWGSSKSGASDGRLYTVGETGGAPEPIFPDRAPQAEHDADLAFSPDRTHIAFSRRTGGQTDLMVARTDGTDLQPLITRPADDQAPTWSPDGRRIAFKSNAPTSAWPGKAVPRIWVTSSTEGDARLLWTRKAPDQQSAPAWR